MVVLAHSFAEPNFLTDFICLFHMPLFFFLSGYCFKDKYIENKITYIKRSLRALYVPFVIVNLIFIGLHNVFFNLNIYNDTYGFMGNTSERYNLHDYIVQIYYTFRFMGQEQLLGGFWFLNCLFFARLLFLLFRYIQNKIVGDKFRVLFSCLFLVSSVIFCLYDWRIPGILGSREVFGFILLWCGYFFKQKEYIVCRYSGIIATFSFVICVIYAIYRPLFYSSSPLTIDRLDYLIPSILGCSFIYFLCSWNCLKDQKYLIYIGSHTLIILALHFISFKLISWIYILLSNSDIKLLAQFAVLENSPKWLWLFYLCSGVFLPLAVRGSYLYIYENLIHSFRGEGRI